MNNETEEEVRDATATFESLLQSSGDPDAIYKEEVTLEEITIALVRDKTAV